MSHKMIFYFSWEEVWKLRYLSKLHTLILSGNPLLDLFFHDNDLDTSCVCFCHHDDNDPTSDCDTDYNRNKHSPEADVNDIDIIVSQNKNLRDFELTQKRDENGNQSFTDDEVIEIWCQKILDDVIAELIQERYSTFKAQNCPLSDENNKTNENDGNYQYFCPNDAKTDTAKAFNNRDQNTRNKIENLAAGSYVFMNSHTRESDKRSNSESSQCECFCNREDLPETGFPSLQTLCVSETNIGKWKHLSALNSFPSLKSLRIKVLYQLYTFIVLDKTHFFNHKLQLTIIISNSKGPEYCVRNNSTLR